MSKELTQLLVEIKQELADVELRIEQYADQGDAASVEHMVEQQTYLNKEIKLIENQLN